MASYRLAYELGADYIEIDLQMTKDGHLVALHDDTLDRTTNGKGKVFLYTLDELKQLDAGSWFNEQFPTFAKHEYEGLTIPTLREIFNEFGHDINYYIEMKNPQQYKNMEDTLILLLEEYGFLEDVTDGNVIISSFNERSLRILSTMEPSLPLTKLQSPYEAKKSTKKTFKKISKYAVAVGPSYKSINEEYIKNALDIGLQIHPYTVDDPFAIEQLEKWGVTGIFTNFIDVSNPDVYIMLNQEGKFDETLFQTFSAAQITKKPPPLNLVGVNFILIHRDGFSVSPFGTPDPSLCFTSNFWYTGPVPLFPSPCFPLCFPLFHFIQLQRNRLFLSYIVHSYLI